MYLCAFLTLFIIVLLSWNGPYTFANPSELGTMFFLRKSCEMANKVFIELKMIFFCKEEAGNH